MTTTTPTLAELVDTNPAVAPLLDRLGLDYCCHGDVTLAEACATVGLDPTAVTAELETIEPATGTPWTTLGITELVDHLLDTHHAYLHAELPALVALAAKVRDVHGERHPELGEVASLVEALRADLEPHLAKEEQVLFPMIRHLAAASTTAPSFHCGTLQNPISVMLSEHDQVGDLLATLRRLTQGYQAPADGCASYRALFDGLAQLEADTHLHVHKENNFLFPAVVALEAELATTSR